MRERSKEKETYWSGAAEEVEAAAEGGGGGCTTTHGRGGGGASFSMDAAEKGEDKEEDKDRQRPLPIYMCNFAKTTPIRLGYIQKSSHPCIFCENNPLRCTVSLGKLSNFQRCQCLKNVKIWVNSIEIQIC